MMSLRPVAATANIVAIATRNTDFNYPLLLRRFLKVLINKTTLLLLSLLCSPAVFAQLPGIINQPLANGGQSWSLPVQTLVFITTLSFLPAALLMMTSFTRIIIVLGLLRNALGTPSAPPIR